MTATLTIADTTLRDGIQMPGASLELAGKVLIAQALESIGVRSLEIGFPAAGSEEIRDIQTVAAAVRRSVVIALCRPLERDINAARLAFESVPRLRCGVNVFLATSPIHRSYKLRMSERDVLDLVSSGITYARRHFRIVSFSAEDASRTERAFLLEVYRTAIAAGATTIGFPDTLGILTPEACQEAVSQIKQNLKADDVRLAVHFHNDLGLATANSLAAIKSGADIVQCTVNGIGERAGNASLEEVVMALCIHNETYGCLTNIDTTALTGLSRLVAEQTGIGIANHKAIVGQNVFSSAAGLHQDGILKNPATYLPFNPSLVGVRTIELVLGRYSGHAAAAAYLASTGVSAKGESVQALLDELKREEIDRPQRRIGVSVS